VPANKLVPNGIKQALTQRNLVIFFIILALTAFIFNNKRWFVPVIVNGSPITGIELMSRLDKDFRTQTLDNMINEKIILDEARKKNALPTKQEVDGKIAELEKMFGGAESFNSLLAQQGETRVGVVRQTEIQLAIEKMYSSEATASSEEIDAYIKTNKASITATDSAVQKAEAEKALKQQKLSKVFLAKFEELKKSASVKIF